VATLLAGLAAGPVAGNAVIPMSQDELIKKASLIVVAQVAECSDAPKPSSSAPCRLRVLATIKGKAPAALVLERTYFVAPGAILSEMSISQCCESGHVYLMYLKPFENRYLSINGYHAVKDVTPHNR